MKRRLLPLALLLLLCACAGPEDGESAPAPADSMTAEQAARAALDSQENAAGLSPLTGEERTAYLTDGCGVEESLWTEAAVYLASGVDAREILVLRLSQTEDGDEVTEALEAHRQERLGDFYGYAPDQVALLEAAVVTAEGGYAALLVCEEPEAARTALLSAIRGELVPAAQTPVEAASARDVTPSDVPSPDSAPSAALDVSGFKPFDPPNEHDMTLYDTSGIRAAWETGDESGLGEKDAAILARCQEIFAAVVTEGMTDFEKELALHDALLRSVRYDETSFDPATPQGQPDSGNPYGALVEGYGICLGYATSLQLLLDLAGGGVHHSGGGLLQLHQRPRLEPGQAGGGVVWGGPHLERPVGVGESAGGDVGQDAPPAFQCDQRRFAPDQPPMGLSQRARGRGHPFFLEWKGRPAGVTAMDCKKARKRYESDFRYCTGAQIKGAARPGHPPHHRQGEGICFQYYPV